jgi:hypothetical protein
LTLSLPSFFLYGVLHSATTVVQGLMTVRGTAQDLLMAVLALTPLPPSGSLLGSLRILAVQSGIQIRWLAQPRRSSSSLPLQGWRSLCFLPPQPVCFPRGGREGKNNLVFSQDEPAGGWTLDFLAEWDQLTVKSQRWVEGGEKAFSLHSFLTWGQGG